jgi:hypothetical protein
MQELGRRRIVHEIAPLGRDMKHANPDHPAKDPCGALSESLKGNGVFRGGRTSLTKAPDQPFAPHSDDSSGTHAPEILFGILSKA